MSSAASMKALSRELSSLQVQPEEGIVVHVNEANLAEIQADISGPSGTPYEGGSFRVLLSCGAEYPQAPPAGHFITRIFHPNVEPVHGRICVNVLQKDWKPEMGLRHVLVVIKCLLVHTNPESALNEEAGRLLQEDYEAFAAHARLMTSIHAQRQAKAPATTEPAGSHEPNQPLQSLSMNNVGSGSGSPAKKPTPLEVPKLANTAAIKAKKGLRRL